MLFVFDGMKVDAGRNELVRYGVSGENEPRQEAHSGSSSKSAANGS